MYSGIYCLQLLRISLIKLKNGINIFLIRFYDFVKNLPIVRKIRQWPLSIFYHCTVFPNKVKINGQKYVNDRSKKC